MPGRTAAPSSELAAVLVSVLLYSGIAVTRGEACNVAVVSAEPAADNPLSVYTEAWAASLRSHPEFQGKCALSLVAVSPAHGAPEPTASEPTGTPVVHTVQPGDAVPSPAVKAAADFINENGFSHVLLQQEHSIMPSIWQLVDLARWIKPEITVIGVVHSLWPRPGVEDRAAIRQLAAFSAHVVAQSRHAQHSLTAAYGVPRDKVLFIPHGVSLPDSPGRQRRQKPSGWESLMRFKPDDLILLYHGRIDQHAGLQRIVAVLPQLVKSHAGVQLVVVGREAAGSAGAAGALLTMEELVASADKAGVRQHVHWLNRAVSAPELAAISDRAAVYIAPHDDSSSISGTMLHAMAAGLPVVATPHLFAAEVLDDTRGIIVPFDDEAAMLPALERLLADKNLRQGMGKASRKFAQAWSWASVAEDYNRLLLDERYKGRPQDASISPGMEPVTASWTESVLEDFMGQTVPQASIPSGSHVLYCDSDIQAAASIQPDGSLEMLGIKTHEFWVLCHVNYGIDFEFNPATPDEQHRLGQQLSVDLKTHTVVVAAANVNVTLQLSADKKLSLRMAVHNRFAHPAGALAASLPAALSMQASAGARKQQQAVPEVNWSLWHLPSGYLYAHNAQGLTWSGHGIQANVFHLRLDDLPRASLNNTPTMRLRQRTPILFRLEGLLFHTSSSFAHVNRRVWFHLQREVIGDAPSAAPEQEPLIEVIVRPSLHAPIPDEDPAADNGSNQFKSVLLYLLHDQHRQQMVAPDRDPKPHVVFRNAWPPVLDPVPDGVVWVHQQPWEYEGLPEEWVERFKAADEVWIPSEYNRQSYIHNGVPKDHITVVRHGIESPKYEFVTDPYPIATKKSFIFLFNAGLLHRKGLDVLLPAYKAAFKASDDVTLFVHATYGKEVPMDQVLNYNKDDPQAPELIFDQTRLSDWDLTAMYKAADVYVTPYRSEGFGLTMLEAMACGLQVVVTKAGPSLELCTDQTCLFVQATPAKCLIWPCGEMQAFDKPTVVQTEWVDPSVESLAEQLRLAYEGRKQAHDQQDAIVQHSRKFGWYEPGTLMRDRVRQLVAAKQGV